MTDQLIIGIDPGKSGGISFFYPNGPVVFPMPNTFHDIFHLFYEHICLCSQHDNDLDKVFAFVEKVHSSPQMGVTSAFTFGQGYGALLMLLTCEGIPFEQVTPQKWQKAMGCMSKGDKNVTKRRAQELFPGLYSPINRASAVA